MATATDDDVTPDGADVVVINGNYFAMIGGLAIPLRHTAEALALLNPPAPPPMSAKQNAVHLESPSLVETTEAEAGRRFDQEPRVRSMFGVRSSNPEDGEYKAARARYLAAAAAERRSL